MVSRNVLLFDTGQKLLARGILNIFSRMDRIDLGVSREAVTFIVVANNTLCKRLILPGMILLTPKLD